MFIRSMALKEATHKEEVEELNDELRGVSEELSKKSRDYDDLTKLSRDQVRDFLPALMNLC